MTGKVIILNGPPGSGKDAIADVMSHNVMWQHVRIKSKLFSQAIEISGIDPSDWHIRYEDRKLKETPWDRLGGLSQRQFLIKISEEWVKPVFGKDFYGKEAGKYALEDITNGYTLVYSDGGFQEEFDAIKSIVGEDNILLVRLHRDGTSWEGDSRGYLKNPGREVDIENNGTIQEVIESIKMEI